MLFELLKNFLFSFGLGDVSKEQTSIRNRDIHFQSFAGGNFVTIKLNCEMSNFFWLVLFGRQKASTNGPKDTAYTSQNTIKQNAITFFAASAAASLSQYVRKAYPRFFKVTGSIINRMSQILPHCSNNGMRESSKSSCGI